MRKERKIETQESAIKKYKKMIESDGQVTVKKEQGITLIALVVTIIIMLILAGVTLTMALGENGLIQKAKKSAEEYKKAEKEDSQSMNDASKEIEKEAIDYNDYVGADVTGYTPTDSTITIETETSGADTSQTFKTESLKWRIWDYDKKTKTIRLISSEPTNAKLILSNVNGYNNGVWAINEICRKCYSNGQDGVTVANLKRSDIQKVSKFDYTQFRHDPGNADEQTDDDPNDIYFGATHQYTTGIYPEIWDKFDRKWAYEYNNGIKNRQDAECTMWEMENSNGHVTGSVSISESTTFKQSYYKHYYTSKEDEFIKPVYYDLLFKKDTNTYFEKMTWLATRTVLLFSNKCNFGIQATTAKAAECKISAPDMLYSWNQVLKQECSLRPMISINLNSSGYTLEKQIDENTVKFNLTE